MELQGILPLHKQKGMTSHDCVSKLRKILKTKKVGHTGTLDPDVTGVLPICIGRATKISEYMTNYPKSYDCEVTIGYSTTTEDFTGEVIQQKKVEKNIDKEKIEIAFSSFLGEIEQTPPMYSAVKVNGKKLYEYARAGIEVERPKRIITIYEISLLTEPTFNGEAVTFSFRVHCSKGTYVRTLAVDIGKKLGFPAHMSNLVRTASGPFTLAQCFTLEEIENMKLTGSIEKAILPMEQALSFMEKVMVDDDTAKKVLNGAVLPTFSNVAENSVTIYNEGGELLAIYQKHPSKSGLYKPEKIIKID